MEPGSRMSVVFASERLLPPVGGAELAALEWLRAVAVRHDVRACFVSEPAAEAALPGLPGLVTRIPVHAPLDARGYWATRRRRRVALGRAVAATLARRRADVVVTQLHGAPAVVEAARDAGVPAILLLPSYESLCKYAFDAGSRCRPSSGCRGCPRAADLDAREAEELVASRDAHAQSLATATRLVAPSRSVAEACVRWCGREPDVIAPVAGAGPAQPAAPTGRVLLVASHWRENKGGELLVPLCRALDHRRIAVTEAGLPDGVEASLRGLAHVSLVGDVSLQELLGGAGALLVPSQWPEPFGRVAFEALAAGVPTLAAAVGGLPEFVPADQLVEPPDSIEAWTAAVRELEEPSRWEAARRSGIAAARAVVASSPVGRMEALLRETSRAPTPRRG